MGVLNCPVNGGSNCSMGSMWKMLPPSLFTSTIVASTPQRSSASSPFESWKYARSPTSPTTGSAVALPAPSADEITPSMPDAPRFPSTARSAPRGAANRSKSRIGMLFETNTVAGSGAPAATVAAISPSSVAAGWKSSTAAQ